ncbi:hypothetical protein CPB86DRAFT_303679 [Serendipita vermifera]|nr:hypothetical protein CPB86DRAFT_303679 [Serendipita vermifera]
MNALHSRRCVFITEGSSCCFPAFSLFHVLLSIRWSKTMTIPRLKGYQIDLIWGKHDACIQCSCTRSVNRTADDLPSRILSTRPIMPPFVYF